MNELYDRDTDEFLTLLPVASRRRLQLGLEIAVLIVAGTLVFGFVFLVALGAFVLTGWAT